MELGLVMVWDLIQGVYNLKNLPGPFPKLGLPGFFI